MELGFLVAWVDQVYLVDDLHAGGLGLGLALVLFLWEEVGEQDGWGWAPSSVLDTLAFSRLILFLQILKPVLLVGAYVWLHAHGFRNALEECHLANALPPVKNQRFLLAAFQTVSAIRLDTVTDEIPVRHFGIAHGSAELVEPAPDLIDGRTREDAPQVARGVFQVPQLVLAAP